MYAVVNMVNAIVSKNTQTIMARLMVVKLMMVIVNYLVSCLRLLWVKTMIMMMTRIVIAIEQREKSRI